MKNLIISFSVLATAFVFSGCTKNQGASTNASVMFVNGCAGTTGIYARVNSSNVGPGNVSFFGNSGYQNIPAGSDNIDLYLTNLGTLLCSSTSALTAADHYSVFAGGIITGSSCVITTDDLTAPASGNAKIRFVNLSSDNLNATFSVGAQSLDSNLAYQQCSSYYQVAAGSYVIKGGDPLHINTIVSTGSTALNAGKIYTVMLTGNQSGSGTSALTLTVIGNN